MLTREDLEKREYDMLAPYAMKSRETRGRRYPEEESRFRTVFQRDRDRIIHSAAFRRLEYKTQVFINHEGDHYRTRLTHTIEVAQIAMSVARTLGLNEELVEAAAYSHDIGHTPFGHSGEEILNQLMNGKGGFEHNLQALRVVELLENRYPEFSGLNLTWETRESIVKHSSRYDDPENREYNPDWPPLLEMQLVNIADEVAYDNHDLDDGLRSGLLRDEELRDLDLWKYAAKKIDTMYSSLSEKIRWNQAVRFLINLEVTDLVQTSAARIEEASMQSLEDVRNRGAGVIGFSDEVAQQKSLLEEHLHTVFYMHHKVQKNAQKAKYFLRKIFEAYAEKPEMLPPEFQRLIDAHGKERVICDYIAGMTDRYAQKDYQRLYAPFEHV